VHLLLKLYQLAVVWWDLMHMGLIAYKEMWLSLFFIIVPLPKKTLRNEVAVVVGSSRGLGFELARKLASLHSTVICIDVQTPDQETLTKRIIEAGGSAFYYQCDITERRQVEATINSIERQVGDITMLYHCCSLPSPRSVITEPPSVKRTIDISVTSYFYVSLLIFAFIRGLSTEIYVFVAYQQTAFWCFVLTQKYLSEDLLITRCLRNVCGTEKVNLVNNSLHNLKFKVKNCLKYLTFDALKLSLSSKFVSVVICFSLFIVQCFHATMSSNFLFSFNRFL
jgi:short chain dehydrogenase